MQFVRASDPSMGKEVLISLLSDTLKTNKVLYLISGGSNLDIEVDILDGIDAEVTKNLSLLFVDERYGPSNHPDSNYTQLINKGFNVKDATLVNILSDNSSPQDTLEIYKYFYNLYKDESDVIIAQLGIGKDGHIAGVLPASPGVNSSAIATYYESDPYKRITLTLEALKDIDKAFVFCFGEDKREALLNLVDGPLDKNSMPSVILRELADVIVYNDQV
jgi:6-phosphogluconolactonase